MCSLLSCPTHLTKSPSTFSLQGASVLPDDDDDDDEEVEEVLTLPLQAHHAMEKMEEFVHKVGIIGLFQKPGSLS